MRGRHPPCRDVQSGCLVPQTTATAAERLLTRSREAAKMSCRFCPKITSHPRHTHCPLTPNPPLAPARGRGVGGEGATSPLVATSNQAAWSCRPPPLQQSDCSREAAQMSSRVCPKITSHPRHTHCPLTPNPPLAPARGRGVGGEGATSPCRDVQSGCLVLQTPATAAVRFLTRSREAAKMSCRFCPKITSHPATLTAR